MKRQLKKEFQKPLLCVTIVMLVLGSSINEQGWNSIPFLVVYLGLIALNMYLLLNYTSVFKEEK